MKKLFTFFAFLLSCSCYIAMAAENEMPLISANAACSFAIMPRMANIPAGGVPNAGFRLTSDDPSCAWTIDPAACPFVNLVRASGSGSAIVNFNVPANTGPARSCTYTVENATFIINQAAGNVCNYQINPPMAFLPLAGGNNSFNITTSDTCNWTVSGTCSFVTVVNNAGQGNGTVSYTLEPNNGPARTCTLQVAGRNYIINQQGFNPNNPCNYNIAPGQRNIPVAGGNNTFTLIANDTCNWTASTNCNFVHVSNASGTGNATVSYSIDPNNNPAARTCTITLGGRTHVITQAGTECTYQIQPGFGFSQQPGGPGMFRIVPSADTCHWSITGICSFIKIQGPTNGQGAATINYTVDPNPGTARVCTLSIGKQIFYLAQQGAIGGNCIYAFAASDTTVDYTAVTAKINLVTLPNCSWTVTSSCSFVTVDNTNGVASGPVNYSITPNPGAAARTCTLTIEGPQPPVAYVITQKGNDNVSAIGALAKAKIHVFPNPANDALNVELPENWKNPNLEIFNVLGAKVLESKNLRLNIAELPGGIYYLKVSAAKANTQSIKFLIVR